MALSPDDIQKLLANGSISQPTADLMIGKPPQQLDSGAGVFASPTQFGPPASLGPNAPDSANLTESEGGGKDYSNIDPFQGFKPTPGPANLGPLTKITVDPNTNQATTNNLGAPMVQAQNTPINAIPEIQVIGNAKTSVKEAPKDPDFKTGDSVEENTRLAQIDSKKAQIDESVANGEIDPATALQQKQALDSDAGNVKNKYNYTPQGYFDWKNAQAHPELYSYDKLKAGLVNDQFNYQDQNRAMDEKINEAMSAKAEAEKARDTAVASQYGEQAAQAQKNQTDLQNWQNNFTAKNLEINQQKQNAVNQYMNTKIDPNNYYKTLGVGGGIFAALTAGLAGAFLNRAEGKSVDNPIVRQVNTNIDRDIEAQKMELAKRRDLVNIKDNDIAHFMQQGFSDRDSILMAQKMGYQKAENLLNQTLAKFNSPVAAANAQIVATGLQAQQAAIDHQLSNNTAQLILGQKAPKAVAAVDSVDPETVFSVDGHQVSFTNKAEAANASKLIPAIDQTNKAIDNLVQRLRDGKNTTPEDRAINHELYGTISGHVSELSSDSTRFNPEETERRVGQLNPSFWNSNTNDSRMAAAEQFKSELNTQRKGILDNGIPVSKGITHNAKTNKNEVGFQIGRGKKPDATAPTIEGAPIK